MNRNFHFEFVQPGTDAPKTVPDNQIWLDVGNRAAPQILDHHGGDTDAGSASQLVLERYQEYILTPLSGEQPVTLVLHRSPDLDAVCAAWLTIKVFEWRNRLPHNDDIKIIVKAVTENDQGLVKTDIPTRCWPVIMRTLLSVDLGNLEDSEKVTEGFTLLEKTFSGLQKGKTLAEVAKQLLSPQTEEALCLAEKQYEKDFAKANLFQTDLPNRKSSTSTDQWLPADGIIVTDPQSELFKELARGDKKNSPHHRGFPLLLIIRTIPIPADRPLQRYIISTDPSTGFHLQRLGACLEQLEQDAENHSIRPLLPGRNRVPSGTGRFGYNVVSPWYDGRGHNFTIVDSPAVTLNNQAICASGLSRNDVLMAIKKLKYLSTTG